MKRKKYPDIHKKLKKMKFFSNEVVLKNESSLISQKSFLEIILEQIKNHQYQFLLDRKNHKQIKEYLNKMKANLLSINNEKMNKQKYLENKIKSKKTQLQFELFCKDNKEDNKKNYIHYKSIDNSKYLQENDIYKLNNFKINYINEKQQLENLCFIAENEINNIDFETQKKINLIINLKTLRYNPEEDLEIMTDQKKLKAKAERIMKKELKDYQQYLLKIINKKIKNELKQKQIKEEIELIKKQIKEKEQYIDTDNVILEESSDFERSIIIKDEHLDINKDKIEKDNENEINKIIDSCKLFLRNRHSVDYLNNINNKLIIKKKNSHVGLNSINDKINKKIIRSLSNRIKKLKLDDLKDNGCKLSINFNFNANNLNIINGQKNESIGKDNYKENLNLTYSNNIFNNKDGFEGNKEFIKSNDNFKCEYNSDKDDEKNRIKRLSMNIKNNSMKKGIKYN